MDDKHAALLATGAAPDEEVFLALAEAALATLPPIFAPHIAGLLLSIEDMADADTLAAVDVEHPYDLTGLYTGRPLTEKSVEESGGLPDVVTLYRIPILIEWVETGERLDHLIRHVLIHEIGHHFGFSDIDMEQIEDMD
ncbi:MAG: metallopeptidase family protein [Sphingopyxis sp.]|nr:metallopeptidase family protein [Sphingopyxis sp.]